MMTTRTRMWQNLICIVCKTRVLHTMHGHFSFLDIFHSFSFFPRHEMTCFWLCGWCQHIDDKNNALCLLQLPTTKRVTVRIISPIFLEYQSLSPSQDWAPLKLRSACVFTHSLNQQQNHSNVCQNTCLLGWTGIFGSDISGWNSFHKSGQKGVNWKKQEIRIL